jgi:hypothetical protein
VKKDRKIFFGEERQEVILSEERQEVYLSEEEHFVIDLMVIKVFSG